MRQLMLRPVIESFESADTFFESLGLRSGDLVVTDEPIWAPYTGCEGDAAVLCTSRYGRGEPCVEWIETMRRDVPIDTRRVVGIGGGAVLDIAKLLSLRWKDCLTDLFDGTADCMRDKALALTPTTCGTGSEVTNLSIVTFPERGVKLGLGNDALFADRALLAPCLLEGMPWPVFAASAADAFIHAVESWLSPRATDFTRVYSAEAARLLLEGFLYIETYGRDARKMQYAPLLKASCMAGIAFGNAGCGAVHAASYPFGADRHVPHGEANARLFMPVLAVYRAKGADMRALDALLTSMLGEDAYGRLATVLDGLHDPKPLTAYGVGKAEVEAYTCAVMARQQRLLHNAPVPLEEEDIRAIYEQAL